MKSQSGHTKLFLMKALQKKKNYFTFGVNTAYLGVIPKSYKTKNLKNFLNISYHISLMV
jgi:hypothetical protein